jgi:hypothetical protein
MPGIIREKTARGVAARELDARSKPLMSCTAIVDRSFVRLRPGDPVVVAWPTPGIASVVFRVVGPDRGTLEDGRVTLDLVQDPFYVWRRLPPPKGGFGDLGGPIG